MNSPSVAALSVVRDTKENRENKQWPRENLMARRARKIGVADGKIRDSLRRRDPCFKIRDRDLKVLTKIRARDSVRRKPSPRLHFAKIRAALENCLQRDMSYTRYSKIDKSKPPPPLEMKPSSSYSLLKFVYLTGH